jgi:hypothetical protein
MPLSPPPPSPWCPSHSGTKLTSPITAPVVQSSSLPMPPPTSSPPALAPPVAGPPVARSTYYIASSALPDKLVVVGYLGLPAAARYLTSPPPRPRPASSSRHPCHRLVHLLGVLRRALLHRPAPAHTTMLVDVLRSGRRAPSLIDVLQSGRRARVSSAGSMAASTTNTSAAGPTHPWRPAATHMGTRWRGNELAPAPQCRSARGGGEANGARRESRRAPTSKGALRRAMRSGGVHGCSEGRTQMGRGRRRPRLVEAEQKGEERPPRTPLPPCALSSRAGSHRWGPGPVPCRWR